MSKIINILVHIQLYRMENLAFMIFLYNYVENNTFFYEILKTRSIVIEKIFFMVPN